MSLRWRLALLLAATVATTVAVVSVTAYAIARSELLAETDRALTSRANEVVDEVRREQNRPGGSDISNELFGGRRPGRRSPIDMSDTVLQLLDEDGSVAATAGSSAALPVSDGDRRLATDPGNEGGRTTAVLVDAEIAGTPYRILTTSLPGGGALQVARAVGGTDEVLQGLRARMLLAGLLGTLVAAGIGWLIARRTVRPVERLTAAAEHVAVTQQLDTAIPVDRDDEVGRLADSFNQMLSALGESREQQQRLVQDAGHELRTPLTSLRTNAEVLQQADRLTPEDRAMLLHDVTEEVQELTDLVAELVLLAQSPDATGEPEADVDLAAVAGAVADRTRRRTGRRIELRSPLGPLLVRGRSAQLERAVTNLMTNADKFSPPGTPIDVTVEPIDDGVRLTVRDRGPGIAPADRTHVFERFYRSDAARAAPGSGLGLSIVDQVVRAHDGRPFVEEAPGGGAVVGFTLPAARLVDTGPPA
ncbi:MAG: ATP-binding protein [Acidimicrobiales bacterium]